MLIVAISEVSNALYCNRDADCRTETDKAKLFFMWQSVTKSNSQELSALFISCK